ncbi:MAG: plasmid pRiA4b ORF-3 family protein [Deltaproteobacteria bacterium]|jgi:hypothetical protein|nr:plasmid pRiA4b ORF-3 family protein [Deltaproteobacteria bacterium]
MAPKTPTTPKTPKKTVKDATVSDVKATKPKTKPKVETQAEAKTEAKVKTKAATEVKTKAESKKKPTKDAAPPTLQPDDVPLYAFQVSLKGSRPKIWRKFFVPSDVNVADFGDIVLKVMGWDVDHLYSFDIFGESFELAPSIALAFVPGLISQDMIDKAEKTTLKDFGFQKGDSFSFRYDYGDDWQHTLKVLDTNYQPKNPGESSGCYAGAGACPPDDCGGIWGFYHLLDVLADPNHPDYEDRKEWVGDEYDPEYFDPDNVYI